MGVGSLLVSWCCQQADQRGKDIFLIASFAALKLYNRFGFEKVGEIEYGGAKFTSMLRKQVAVICAHLEPT